MLGKPSPPQDRGGAIAAHLPPNGAIAEPFGGKQNNAAAQHHPLRRSQLTRGLLKVLTLGIGQDNRHGSWTRHRSLLGEIICLFDKLAEILSLTA
jgi:hypothetical protein